MFFKIGLLVLTIFAGCKDEISLHKLSNGNFLVEYDGRQWEVEAGDLDRAKENLRRYGLPYGKWSDVESQNWYGCEAAGGLWHEDSLSCVWSLSHYPGDKPRLVKP
jgi:hypothetical protein